MFVGRMNLVGVTVLEGAMFFISFSTCRRAERSIARIPPSVRGTRRGCAPSILPSAASRTWPFVLLFRSRLDPTDKPKGARSPVGKLFINGTVEPQNRSCHKEGGSPRRNMIIRDGTD